MEWHLSSSKKTSLSRKVPHGHPAAAAVLDRLRYGFAVSNNPKETIMLKEPEKTPGAGHGSVEEKKGPLVVLGYKKNMGWNATQLCGDYFINHENKDPLGIY